MKTSSSGRRATSEGAPGAARRLAIAALLAAACGGRATPPAAPANDAAAVGGARLRFTAAIDFSFDSLDDRPLSADSTRGKPALIAFVTTESLPSQAQVDFLVAMAGHDGDRVRYGVVAMDRAQDREIVEMYVKALAIPFPAAMADAETLAGAGPFGDVRAVPVTVLLDRAGRVVWRVAGRVAKSEEIRAAMRGL